MADDAAPGPIDFVLIEFPDGADTAAVGEALGALLDQGVVRLFDLAAITKADDGTVTVVELADDDGFAAFAGATSGLLDDDDIAEAASVLEPGTSAVLLVYENAWASPFVTAAHAAGGRLVASERIPAQTLLDVLDAVEASA